MAGPAGSYSQGSEWVRCGGERGGTSEPASLALRLPLPPPRLACVLTTGGRSNSLISF